MMRAAVFAGVLGSFLVIGAGATPAAEQQDNLLARIKEKGVLRACTAAYSPWNVKNPVTNEWEGIVADIVKEIGESLKVKVEWVDTSFSTIIPSLQSDKCELGAAPLWTAPQRAEQVSFTRPIGGDGMTIFVPASSAAKSLADVDKKGTVVAVLSGSADERVAKSLFKNAEVKSIVSDKPSPAVTELAAGRADAASAAFAGTSQFVKSNPSMKVKPIEGLFYNFTPFAFAVPAKEYFLRDYFSVVIGNLDASGKLTDIRDKWTKIEN
ncbi:MAG: amino acid ABC transporter substrate-binding protein [Alphaproteobacteria bacterium]|nr:amino acid ABC transporter substrate-binding protein [Alphaproteobacteria bacterium]